MSDVMQLFTEGWALLGVINPASHNSEKNTGYVSLANYPRAVILIHCGVIGGDLDIDIEEGTNTSGAGAQTFDSGAKDITKTATTDNNTVSAIEIKSSECDVADGYHCINVEVTPASAGIFGVQIWGLAAYKPAPTTLLDSVTD